VQEPFRAWAISLAALIAAVLLRWLLDPLMGDALPLVTLFGAVGAAAWVGGYLPATVVAVLGYVACNYLFIAPRSAVGPLDMSTVVGFAAYVFTCALIIGVGEAMRAARQRVSEHAELLRVTLGSIGDAVITTDIEGRVASLNAAAESLTGWTTAEARGRPLDSVLRILDEETRKPIESPAARALREDAVVGLANHAILIARDGVERPIDDSAAPIKDQKGRVSGCVLVFRDISQRRQWENIAAGRLLDARLLAAIVESSDDAIVSKSLDGTIRSWNAGAERLFGYTAEQAVGRHISLVIPPDRIAEEDKIIASIRAGERVDHFETERRRSDGNRIQVSLTISPIKDDAGNVVGASKIARDITDRKQAEAERERLNDSLRKLAADLSEVDRRKNEFLATLSHELRNPLAPIRNMLEVLKRGNKDTAGQAVDMMERQLGQLVRLVDDLLDISRITHNRIELRRARIDLASAIEQAVEASRPVADEVGHKIEVRLPRESIYVHADPVRLTQIIDNLLNNSCKYTPPGGRISVTAERNSGEAVITIADTGIGIPPENLSSIFEMFTQIGGSLERSRGGLGIGLTLVKRLVEMHGGSIEARSAGEGRGSEFVVRLPAITEPGKTQPATSVPHEPARTYRILVVDDNRDAATSLATLLQMTGHEVNTAFDGPTALEAIEKHRPEVVLLDIGLPGISGFEVCRRARAQPWGGDITFIALTGWGQEEDRRKTQEAGFDSHLVKPVEFAALVAQLDSLGAMRKA
jgi:PAS domain S-box-containing protein